MIFQNIEQIIDVIENPRNQKDISRGSSIKQKHELHISGIGLDKYINKIEGIENENALSVRRALAKEATVPQYGKALKGFDKVFSARGGSSIYDFSNDKDKKAFVNTIF